MPSRTKTPRNKQIPSRGRGRPRQPERTRSTLYRPLLPKPEEIQDATGASVPSLHSLVVLPTPKVRDPGASPGTISVAQYAVGARMASISPDINHAYIYRQTAEGVHINCPIGQRNTSQGPGVSEELLRVAGPKLSPMYVYPELIPVRLEAIYTLRYLNCWAAGIRSPKTKLNRQLISSLLGIPLQQLYGRRIEASIKHFSGMEYDPRIWEEVDWADDPDGCSPWFGDVPGCALGLSVLHSACIREGHSLIIRLTEGRVDGGCAEPPPARGGEVIRVGGSLGPWNSGPLWTRPDGTCVSFIHGHYLVKYDQYPISTAAGRLDVFAAAAPVACAHQRTIRIAAATLVGVLTDMRIYSLASQPGSSSYRLPLTQPTENPVHQTVGCQNYPSEYYMLGSQEPEDIGMGIPEPLLTPEECSQSPSSWDGRPTSSWDSPGQPELCSHSPASWEELPTSGWDSPGQPELCDSTPGPSTHMPQMLYEGNYYPCPDPADNNSVSDSGYLQYLQGRSAGPFLPRD